jgi:hypothetical protein
MATQKQLKALEKARAAKVKKTAKQVVSKKKIKTSARKLNGTELKWEKTNHRTYVEYKVIQGGYLRKTFDNLEKAKEYGKNLKNAKHIYIRKVTTCSFLHLV